MVSLYPLEYIPKAQVMGLGLTEDEFSEARLKHGIPGLLTTPQSS